MIREVSEPRKMNNRIYTNKTKSFSKPGFPLKYDVHGNLFQISIGPFKGDGFQIDRPTCEDVWHSITRRNPTKWSPQLRNSESSAKNDGSTVDGNQKSGVKTS